MSEKQYIEHCGKCMPAELVNELVEWFSRPETAKSYVNLTETYPTLFNLLLRISALTLAQKKERLLK